MFLSTLSSAFLLATRHRLIGQVPYPHSTKGAVGGGWWIFHQLRRRIVRLASVEGAEINEQQALDLLRDFASHGEMIRVRLF
jgi:hypothetical protein